MTELSSLATDGAASCAIDWSAFDDAALLITGATGLIGAHLVRMLLTRDNQYGTATRLLLPVRDPAKAHALFGDDPRLDIRPWQLTEPLPADWIPDYVVHGANPTASRDFVERPVETIDAILDGTRAVLTFAQNHPLKKLVYLSTMEVYGDTAGPVDETALGALDPLIVRNSYPEAKRLAESLCSAYAAEYCVPAVIARLAQTFGVGVLPDDTRVFAQFGRAIITRESIVLATDGSKRNMYVSTTDAVTAILTLLTAGAPGQAYNVANDATYCSVREMAELVLATFGDPSQTVIVGDSGNAALYRNASDLQLDTTRLRALGWKPTEDLTAMYQAMLGYWAQWEA